MSDPLPWLREFLRENNGDFSRPFLLKIEARIRSELDRERAAERERVLGIVRKVSARNEASSKRARAAGRDLVAECRQSDVETCQEIARAIEIATLPQEAAATPSDGDAPRCCKCAAPILSHERATHFSDRGWMHRGCMLTHAPSEPLTPAAVREIENRLTFLENMQRSDDRRIGDLFARIAALESSGVRKEIEDFIEDRLPDVYATMRAVPALEARKNG